MNEPHDEAMPDGWHLIKEVLLTEMSTAATFEQCLLCADALYHARILADTKRRKHDHGRITRNN
jgi:hypothetical protein